MSDGEKRMKIIAEHQSWKSVTRHKETTYETENRVLQGEWGESAYSSVRRKQKLWENWLLYPRGGGTWI